eukprot:gene10660-14316_t
MLTHNQLSNIVQIPSLAWPTLLLTVVCAMVEIIVIILLSHDKIPRPVGTVINIGAIFAMFTPLHDSAHGSVACGKYGWINNFVGLFAGFFMGLPFPAFKNLHLLHHKHTNDLALDPDIWASSGSSFLLPARWMTTEWYYYYLYLPKLHKRPLAEACTAILQLILIASFIIYWCYYGFISTLMWGWIIPGRVAIGCLAFSFDYLPHRPHNITRHDNIYKATNVTSLYGNESWYLTWPLFHQNYHNIHHLAPYIPFYMYSIVWNAKKSDLLLKGTEIKPIL